MLIEAPTDGGAPRSKSPEVIDRTQAHAPQPIWCAGDWDRVAQGLGERYVGDVNRAISMNSNPRYLTSDLRAALLFSSWLGQDNDDELRAAARKTYSAPPDSPPSEAVTQRTCMLYRRYYADLHASNFVAPVTAFEFARRGAYVLQWLGELPGSGYPQYLRLFHQVRKPYAQGPSLGELDWPEFKGFSGVDRERRALSMAREAASDCFDHHELVFRFGQEMIRADAPPLTVDPASWSEIHRCLVEAASSWPALDPLSHNYSRDVVRGAAATVRRADSWLAAGMPKHCVDRIWEGADELGATGLGTLVMRCLASSLEAAVAASIVFCCDTGWNKESILDLPVNPVAFRSEGKTGVASMTFMASFKRSASHLVVTRIAADGAVPGWLVQDLLVEWDKTAPVAESTAGATGSAILDGDGFAVMHILERFRPMADAARLIHLQCRRSRRLLVVPPPLGIATTHDGLYSDRFFRASILDDGVMRRAGLSFDAIRKTHLRIRNERSDSMTAVIPIAGHHAYGVLMRHYLLSEDVRAELRMAMTFYLNAFQAIIASGRPGAATTLGLPDADLEWFGRLAAASGMSAALGASTAPPGAFRPGFRFDPTESNLKELFLVHRALRKAAHEQPATQWRARCLPLLAAVKAIGSMVCAKGLRNAYRKAARAAHASLMAGEIVLPPVGGA